MPVKGYRRGTILIAIGLSLTLCFAVVLFLHLPPHSDNDASSALKGRLDEFLIGKDNNLLEPSNDAGQRHEAKNQKPPMSNVLLSKQSVTHQGVVSLLENDKPKLQSVLDQIYVETGKAYQGDLWEVSHLIPHWMKDYFAWHKQQRHNLTISNWQSHRFWIMQCLGDQESTCGGTADRLKLFPHVVRMAYDTQRILLIHWTMPARLESWLVPPKGGIDWRAPTWMESIIANPNNGVKQLRLKRIKDSNTTILRSRFQSTTGYASEYNERIGPGESRFEEVYHDIWRVFFTPAPAVAELVQAEMDRMELVPGEYAAAHLRALYGRNIDREETEAKEWTNNALNCASNLRPGGPFLFASDHTYSQTAALEYGLERNAKIVSRIHDKLPLHLDKVEDWESRQPSEFYDVFVDLYLMGMSRCLTYNRGGFGQWALLIGYNSTCLLSQRTSQAGIGYRCNWTEPVVPGPKVRRSIAPLFPEPMA